MKAELIRIGNSQGIRIPKPIIEQCGFVDSVDIIVEGDALIVRPARKVREGWEDRFRVMSATGDDHLLDEDSASPDWDDTEWQW
jgi:antitoxin MazE